MRKSNKSSNENQKEAVPAARWWTPMAIFHAFVSPVSAQEFNKSLEENRTAQRQGDEAVKHHEALNEDIQSFSESLKKTMPGSP